ncbi:hypothetical protein PUN28_009468 [Cardiocondyla obscurior]
MYSFSMILLHFIVMSLVGVQVINFMSEKTILVRYLAMVIGGFIHLLVLSFPGQEIIDHSSEVFHKAYNMMWYKTSRKTTKLLSILLYRSLEPCVLTAGKIYVLSFQNYASVMQATFSYFTTLTSFQS